MNDLHSKSALEAPLIAVELTFTKISAKHKAVIHVPESMSGSKLVKFYAKKRHLLKAARHKAYMLNER